MRRFAKNATLAAVCAGLGLSLTVTVANAQEMGNYLRRGKGPADVSLDVVERPLKDVVAFIQEKTEVNLVLAAEAEDVPVTVKLKNLRGARRWMSLQNGPAARSMSAART